MKKTGLTFALMIAACSPLVLARSHGDHGDQKDVPQNAQATKSEARLALQAPREAQGSFNIMMTALETNDFGSYVAPGETAFAMAVTEPMFSKASAQIAPLLKKGYQAIYLGQMKQRGYDVFLWKVSFKDGSDDLLASLNMKTGKVGGFFLR